MVIHNGHIKDQYGQPLIGAHIVLKGNPTIGTITDFDGNFQISGSEGQTYMIGHLGKKATEVTLKNGMPSGQYILVDDAFVLDEFVGTALRKRKNVLLSILSLATILFIGNRIFN